ncbi:MAG TPA: HAD family hydrolase [Pseudonocardia sp.]|nr:HAD family hydrolase [Pseudonocardia sp.]
MLAAIGWRVGEQLDAVVCADEVAAGRPAPDMIERAMELTGVTVPARVLVAGDTVLDVRAGHAAGAGVVVAVLPERRRPTSSPPSTPPGSWTGCVSCPVSWPLHPPVTRRPGSPSDPAGHGTARLR